MIKSIEEEVIKVEDNGYESKRLLVKDKFPTGSNLSCSGISMIGDKCLKNTVSLLVQM